MYYHRRTDNLYEILEIAPLLKIPNFSESPPFRKGRFTRKNCFPNFPQDGAREGAIISYEFLAKV